MLWISNVSTRQHTSAYVSIRQHTSACVSIRQEVVGKAVVEAVTITFQLSSSKAAVSVIIILLKTKTLHKTTVPSFCVVF